MKKRGRAKIKKNTLPRTKDEDHDHYYHDHAHEDIGEEEELLVPQESPSDPSSDEDGPVTSQHSHEILQHSLDLSNQEDTETLEDAPEIESPRRNSFGPILPFLINVITHNDKKLLGHDLGCDSRYTDDPSNDSGDESPAEDECELFEEIKCWWELNRSQLQVNQKMQGDLTQVKDLWQDVLRDLRNMQWHRVKANLQKLSESEGNQVMGLSPAMIVWSAGGLIHHVNDAFCALSGYSMQELEVSIDGNSRMLASSLFDDVSIWKNQLEVAGHSHRSAYHLKTRIVSKDCREIPVTLSVTNLRDSLGFSLLTIAHLVPNLAATSRHWSGTILHHQQGLGVSMFA